MRQFLEDAQTPSNMPIRQQFGNWTGFVKSMGLTVNKPTFSKLARENSIKAHKGRRSFGWKGGRYKDPKGYVLIWTNGKYKAEHRLVMEKRLGRLLNSWEFVHHKNAVKNDNCLENLELMTKKVHRGKVECPYCRKEFAIR